MAHLPSVRGSQHRLSRLSRRVSICCIAELYSAGRSQPSGGGADWSSAVPMAKKRRKLVARSADILVRFPGATALRGGQECPRSSSRVATNVVTLYGGYNWLSLKHGRTHKFAAQFGPRALQTIIETIVVDIPAVRARPDLLLQRSCSISKARVWTIFGCAMIHRSRSNLPGALRSKRLSGCLKNGSSRRKEAHSCRTRRGFSRNNEPPHVGCYRPARVLKQALSRPEHSHAVAQSTGYDGSKLGLGGRCPLVRANKSQSRRQKRAAIRTDWRRATVHRPNDRAGAGHAFIECWNGELRNNRQFTLRLNR